MARRIYIALDESGTFMETSADRAEAAGARLAPQGPSQIAGLVAVDDAGLDVPRAFQAMKAAYGAVGRELTTETHANEEPRGDTRDQLVCALIDEVTSIGWQPARLVNAEGASWGNKVDCYTSMIAEFVLRVAELMGGVDGPTDGIELLLPYYLFDPDAGQRLYWKHYKDQIEWTLAFTAIRRGRPHFARKWKVVSHRIDSAKKDRVLQICDWLSHSTKNGFDRSGPQAQLRLKEALGQFDFTIGLGDIGFRVPLLMESGLIGAALVVIGERVATAEGDLLPEHVVRSCVERLALCSASSFWSHLESLLNWIEAVLDDERRITAAERVLDWCLGSLLSAVHAATRTEHAGCIARFEHGARRLQLIAANHRGDLLVAHQASSAIDALVPSLAGRWEAAGQLLQAAVVQAVHKHDLMEFSSARERAERVADFFGTLGEFFTGAYSEFDDVVRSDVRGRALGTQLQAMVAEALEAGGSFDAARAVSEAAMVEFSGESDRHQQEQYRSALESFAGDYGVARQWLARSLSRADAAPADLAAHVRDLPAIARGWAMLHLLRIGARAGLNAIPAEVTIACDAIRATRLKRTEWWSSDEVEFPAHGILAFSAIIFAAGGSAGESVAAIDRLRKLCERERQLATEPYLLMALGGCGALLAQQGDGAYVALLEEARTVAAAERSVLKQFPAMQARFSELATAAAGVVNEPGGVSAAEALLSQVRRFAL